MLIDVNILQKYNIIPIGVIHVGMHTAEEYPIYKGAGVEYILFIEANEKLVNDCKINDDKCIIVHAAVSDKKEEVEFNITNNGQSSSILELGDHAEIYPHIRYVETVNMTTTTLDEILKVVGLYIFNWNILNLDIQGVELKAMKGLSDWSGIEAVFTEINYREMYKGCALEPEVTEFLHEKGFDKAEEYDTGCGWGDALYIKK